MTYKVDRVDKEVYDTCEKHTFKITKDGETVLERRVSYSNWQLNDGDYERRVKDFVYNHVPQASRKDVEVNI